MGLLKLIAFDEEDLAVISAHLQDAQVSVGNMAYIPKSRRFVFAALRVGKSLEPSSMSLYSGIHFDNVIAVRLHQIDQKQLDMVLILIGILFENTDSPGGKITLLFQGDRSVQLDVECIEVLLRDFPIRE